MNKKLQVFVSSTYTDLIEERQAAVEAILNAGHIPAGMELFKAGKSQMKTIQKWIDESDVYMLILGGRYGSIEEESGLSYTELEYRYAVSKGMPVFTIILKDNFLFIKAADKGKNAIFEENNTDKYECFKTFVQNNIVKFAENIDQINTNIHSQLNDILNDSEYELIGWVRYNAIKTTIAESSDSYKNSILNDFLHICEDLLSKLNNLLMNMYTFKENNTSFTTDWNLFAHNLLNLHHFYSINKFFLNYYDEELQNIFSIWDKLVELMTNIVTNQNRTTTSNDNKSTEKLFHDLNNSLSKIICMFESKN